MEYDVIYKKLKESDAKVAEIAREAGLSRTAVYSIKDWTERTRLKDRTAKSIDDALFWNVRKSHQSIISINSKIIEELETEFFVNIEEFEKVITKLFYGYVHVVQVVKFKDNVKIIEGEEIVKSIKDFKNNRLCRGKKLNESERVDTIEDILRNAKIIYIEYIANSKEEFEEIVFDLNGGLNIFSEEEKNDIN